MRRGLIGAAVIALALTGARAGESDIKLPGDGDDYSKLVARAMAHDDTVDFHALRVAYLASAARTRMDLGAFSRIQKEMMDAAATDGGTPTVRAKAEQLLSIDFTDLGAQKMLRQSCALLHDDACAGLHHFIEFGLLQSIVGSGDAKTCATGWEATQVKEEYFVLAMAGGAFQQQALVSDGGHACDRMTVRTEQGQMVDYYFNIDRMMAAEAADLAPKH